MLLLAFTSIIIIQQYIQSSKLVENYKIASKIVYSDALKTVWEMTVAPGETFPYHTHKNDYFFFVIQGSTLEDLDINGNRTSVFEAKSGDILSFKIIGDKLVSDKVTAPVSHSFRNVGSTMYISIFCN